MTRRAVGVLLACSLAGEGCLIRRKALTPVAAPPGPLATVKVGNMPTIPSAAKPETELEQKLDGGLLALVRSAAETKQVSAGVRKVKVDIALTNAQSVSAFQVKLKQVGGEPIVVIENHVFAWIPSDSILKLSALPDVWTLALTQVSVSEK